MSILNCRTWMSSLRSAADDRPLAEGWEVHHELLLLGAALCSIAT